LIAHRSIRRVALAMAIVLVALCVLALAASQRLAHAATPPDLGGAAGSPVA